MGFKNYIDIYPHSSPYIDRFILLSYFFNFYPKFLTTQNKSETCKLETKKKKNPRKYHKNSKSKAIP